MLPVLNVPKFITIPKPWVCCLCLEKNDSSVEKHRHGGEYPVCPQCVEAIENKATLRENELEHSLEEPTEEYDDYGEKEG